MAALRLRLQKEMFDVTEEQLLALAHVTNSQEQEKRKKRELSLCLVRTRDVPVYVKLVLVKRTEKDTYKRKVEWQLRDLKVLDGLGADSAEMRFELEERHTWLAASLEEKDAFLKVVQTMCERYNVGRKTKFLNMRPSEVPVGEAASARGQGNEEGVAEEEAAYQAISAKETTDLRALMQGCDTAVTAADQFADRLTAELSVLDGANIHSMMASEEAVDHLMDLLTAAINESEMLEQRLNQYDDLLEHIRDSMEKMEGKTESLETVNENNSALCQELDSLVQKLQVSYEHQQILQEADFSNPADLDIVVEAAWALATAMLAPIPYSLTRLAAVQEQRKRMDRWKERFSKSLCRHFNNVFISLGNEGGEGLGHRDLHLPLRTRLHQELLPYSRLMHWLKQVEPKNYQQLQSTYTCSLEKLYQRDLDRFFEDAFVRVNGSGASVVASQDLRGKVGKGGVAGGTRLLGSERWGELDKETVQERLNFDLVTRKLLAGLEPVVMAEQEFCVAFFKMDSKLGEERPGGRVVAARTKKQVTEEVRAMMSALFGAPASDSGVEPLLVRFLSHYETRDGYYSMLSYVRLSTAVLSAQDTGSYLAITLGSALVQTKRNFDRVMQQQMRSIEEARPPKHRGKCGILGFVANFMEFAETTEKIFGDSDRKGDLEKWYLTLVTCMNESIVRIAQEHGKTPQAVVKMENYHRLHATLSRLKIPVLDSIRRDTKQKYNDALHSYVTQYFGRPLEKVNIFFDGVSARINAGVKEAEISYQLQFSKQELKKVVHAYPGREVRAGLEKLYKKVEKHLSEEENLLQVVWHHMQEEFIRQYKYIEDLLQRCYPGAQICLDFTMEDILEYFSGIAMHH